ncbi:60S ribosomal protein L13 [Entomophthora muscae]|uniref:60S ribosomal protein L13 n=1 Tax=Entomophthora muscae TaxID=34485 RepID=A0ACC2TAG9_9FUNG|nr:60S ribosomal protein L13 [Entomophthora muscae]
MVLKHNNQLPNAHFRKDWQSRVKTWFNQPGKKIRRSRLRKEKAAKIAPRPVDGLLRPAVRCPTIRYNIKLRKGRGFTLEELKAAGVHRREARNIGIAVDHRRRNKSEESLSLNVERLRSYMSKLIVFPKNSKKAKAAGKTEDYSDVKQYTGPLFPIVNKPTVEAPRAITAEEKNFKAFETLCNARMDARLKGKRDKMRKEKAEEEANKVKK